MTENKGRERRLKPRYHASLPCTLALPENERDILFPRERLECRTRDLSESGIGLNTPSIYLGYVCIVDEERTLELSIDLPDATVRMKTTAAHYLRTSGEDDEPNYIVGLRISEMEDADRAAFASFLEELAAR